MTPTQPESKSRVFRFGQFEVNLEREAVLENGEVLSLRPKSFAVLRCLLENHGKLVSRDALIEAVWGDESATDVSLNQCLIDIRRVLRDSDYEFIRTIPRRGYVFEADLAPEETSEAKSSGAATLRWRWVVAIVALLVVSIVIGRYFASDKDASVSEPPPAAALEVASIAVLPFPVIGAADPSGFDQTSSAAGLSDLEFFALGIHDDVLTMLSAIPDLKVISRTSVMEYVNTNKNIPQIAGEMGVQYVLEGSVRSVGDRIRMNIQLIEASTDTHLWSETFERELTMADIFTIQSEISEQVANALKLSLVPVSRGVNDARHTDNLEAYRNYLAATTLSDSKEEWQRAHQLLESAIKLDPEFALAWIQLAYLQQQQFWFTEGRPPELLEKSRQTLRHAETIDPTLPEIHWVRALQLYHGEYDYEGALAELELARGMANSAEIAYWKGNILRRMGRMKEALIEFSHASELSPLDVANHIAVAVALIGLRRFEEARKILNQTVEISPQSVIPHLELAQIEAVEGGDFSALARFLSNWDTPIDLFRPWYAYLAEDLELALALAPELDGEMVGHALGEEIHGRILAAAGRTAQSRERLGEALKKARALIEQEPADAHHRLSLASALAALGNDSEAVVEARQAADLFDQQVDFFVHAEFQANLALVACEAGDMALAEESFEWLLSRPTGITMVYLLNYWPECEQRRAEMP